jgi:phosphatidylglycerol:prolipoprotein diacylglycerol transferase
MYVYTFAWLYWNPPREAFVIPVLQHPIFWYGIFFVTGFIVSYFLVQRILSSFLLQSSQVSVLDVLNWPRFIDILFNSPSSSIQILRNEINPSLLQKLTSNPTPSTVLQNQVLAYLSTCLQQKKISKKNLFQLFEGAMASCQQIAYFLTDRLCWFVVVGTIVGARLGAVFFYDWSYFRQHPIDIFKIWEGGLASHGGAIGVICAIYFYRLHIRKWIPNLSFLYLLDYVAIPSALTGFFIRLGNLMNQEILGTPTNLPWGIIFGHPADGSLPTPRHPIQLYEAFAYLLIFIFLWLLWYKNSEKQSPGLISGLFFISVFTCRFILEFWKAPQNSLINFTFIQMGQLLSLPFIILGIYLVWHANCHANEKFELLR